MSDDIPCFLSRTGCQNLATLMVEGRHLALQCCASHEEEVKIIVGQPAVVSDLAEWRAINGR